MESSSGEQSGGGRIDVSASRRAKTTHRIIVSHIAIIIAILDIGVVATAD